MKFALTNWQTTLVGSLYAAFTFAAMAFDIPVEFVTGIGAFLVWLGFLKSKDSTVTGGTKINAKSLYK